MEYRTDILSVELSQGDFPLRCRVTLKVAKGEEEGEQGKRRKECVCVSYRERVGRKSHEEIRRDARVSCGPWRGRGSSIALVFRQWKHTTASSPRRQARTSLDNARRYG